LVCNTQIALGGFSPLVCLVLGAASRICAGRGRAGRCFAAGGLASGSGVPSTLRLLPSRPAAPSKTLARGGSRGAGEPSARSRAPLGVCTSPHPKPLDIAKTQISRTGAQRAPRRNAAAPPPPSPSAGSGRRERRQRQQIPLQILLPWRLVLHCFCDTSPCFIALVPFLFFFFNWRLLQQN